MNKSSILFCVVSCFIFIQFSNSTLAQTQSSIPTPTPANLVAQKDIIIPAYQKHFYNLFEAGVDISFYEHYWSSADIISKKNVYHKLDLARTIGFKTIGIPARFELFLDNGKTTFNEKRLKNMEKFFQYITEHKMNLIITYHFGVTREVSEVDLEKEINKLITVWGRLITLFKGKGYDNLYFGLYDEPRTTHELWDYANKKMMKALRQLDPNRYWIIGSNNYMNVNAFEHLIPIPNDDKILYTFHFYHPYIFTHQGADWDNEKAYMKHLPYPYTAEEMGPMPARAKGTDMEYNYNNYPNKANRAYLEGLIKIAHDWAVKNQVPIICTETGNLKTIDEKYRNNYFKDVTELMTKYGIPLLVWDLDQKLGIVDRNGAPLKSISDWVNSYK
jgi:endoglucanase